MQRGFGLGQRGAVIPLVAICLSALMGFAGMAVDVGFLEYQQGAQQAATDAAAEGAAQAAYADGCQSSSAAQTAATNDATINGFTSGGNITVTAQADPTSGPYANNPCAVSVTIKNGKVQTFFARVLGFKSMAETTQAVGVASQNNAGCIWLLSTSSQSDFSNSNISTPGCNLFINDSANFSNSTINAAYIGTANGTNDVSGATFKNASPTTMSTVSDPCPQMPGCAYLTNNPPPCSVAAPGSYGGNVTVGAAGTTTCFSSLTISGGSNGAQPTTVCGVIAVLGSLSLNGATINSCSSGVTIYMSAAAQTTNFSNAHLTLSAPTTGNTRGVVMWRSSAQSSAVDFSNCTCSLSGLMYFPTSQVNYSSAAGVYTVMVFGQANFSTSTGLNLASPPPGGTVALKAVLGE